MSLAIGSKDDPATDNSVIGLLKRSLGFSGSTPPAEPAVAPAAQVSTNDPTYVAGSKLDTLGGKRSVAYRIQNTGANDIDVRVEASIDNANWTELTTLDAAGAERAAGPITIAAAAAALAFVTDGYDAGAKAAFRYFRVTVESTVNDTPGEATVVGFAK